jgi:hypothetical protein
MQKIHDAKGQDYEGNGRPYENLREGEDWGVQPWVMSMMRVGEKMRRVKSFAQKGTLQNESLTDSLMDIAILSLIAIVLMEEEAKTSSASPQPAQEPVKDYYDSEAPECSQQLNSMPLGPYIWCNSSECGEHPVPLRHLAG